MPEMLDIIIPRENVNDETATLIAWLVEDGSRVERGQCVAQIETSKATLDLEAPAAGMIKHLFPVGQEVAVGAAIGHVGVALAGTGGPAAVEVRPENFSVDRAEPAALKPEPVGAGATRISAKAKELIRQLGLDEASFQGKGLVRSRDIESPAKAVFPDPAPLSPAQTFPQVAAAGVPTHVQALSRAKRTEANYLRAGKQSTLTSVVTVTCRTRGFREASRGQAAPIIVCETARLLAKYPEFNAFHDNGSVHFYDEVNIGFAVDTGRNLRVPVIRRADRKDINGLVDEMRDLTVACLNNTLSLEALAGGTFTVTDLSGEGATLIHPLINRGQSAILGVCAEVFPGQGEWGTFNLVLAFDHQLGEGRSATRFLKDLALRLEHHETSMVRRDEPRPVEMPRCARCMRSHAELAASDNLLLQAVKADGTVQLLCSLCVGGWS